MATLIWSFLVYYLIVYVVCYITVEYGQNYFYDEVTPGAAVKVGLGAAILAGMLTWTRSNFADMFTAEIGKTVLLAIAWSGVFILLYRFHPWHGFGLAMATLLIFAGMLTIVRDSFLEPKPPGRMDTSIENNKPIRRPAYGTQPTTPKAEAEPKK